MHFCQNARKPKVSYLVLRLVNLHGPQFHFPCSEESQPCLGSTEDLMSFFKETCPRIEIFHRTLTLLCLILHRILLPSGCTFWAALLVRALELSWFSHPHRDHNRDHNSMPYALQDIRPEFRAWTVATEQSKAEWPHTGSEPLTTAP